MPETVQTQTETPRIFGWCSWHDGHAEGVRLIHAVEQASGPGMNLSACPDCRTAHKLTPLADLP